MALSDYVNTLGQDLLHRYGERVHKVSLHAGFTCPNRDGSKGIGGCTFCNNVSFAPMAREQAAVREQIASGRRVIRRRTGARKYLAYFQAYTNTYGDVERLSTLYEQALAEPDVVGLAIGTRPDCVPPAVLDLLAGYRDRGCEVWLELGLQSAFDATLARVNRGHGWDEYVVTRKAAQARGIPVCTHLIIGLPGEGRWHARQTLLRVLALGVEGLKLHPLHVVKGTRLANAWRRGEYSPLTLEAYVDIAADLIQMTPPTVVYHRVTATASPNILLAPQWCSRKWQVLNAIETELASRAGVSPVRLAPSSNGFEVINGTGLSGR